MSDFSEAKRAVAKFDEEYGTKQEMDWDRGPSDRGLAGTGSGRGEPNTGQGFREKGKRGPTFKCALCNETNEISHEDLEEAGWKYQPLDSHNPDDLVGDDEQDEED